MKLQPYLYFTGNCAQAFAFYEEVFAGSTLLMSQTYAEAPEEVEYRESDSTKIMHISLQVGETILMGSDVPACYEESFVLGSNIAINIGLDSREEVERIFAGLSKDGKVEMPLEDTFWGAYFGMVIDKFGIHWSLNCPN